MTLPLYQGAKKKFTKDYIGAIAKKSQDQRQASRGDY